MTAPWRIGVGHVGASGPGTLCLFVPSDGPACRAADDHVAGAAVWALTVLGHGHRGGTLLTVAAGPTALEECLAAAMAVDDAVAGGHRPGAGPGAGLVEHTLRTPHALAALAAAAGVELA
jgi:hypothetical protein